MSKYDVIVLLGTQPDPTTFQFPKQIFECLDKTVELFNEGRAPYIATSGDKALKFYNLGIEQPFIEAEEMAKLLIKRGIPKQKILLETDSRDTISNLYYLKTQIFIPKNMTKLIFVIASFRIPRLKLLADKVLGSDYKITYEAVPSQQGPSYNEAHTIKIQSTFLEPMRNGDHDWLKDKFYIADMYKYWAKRDVG